LRNIGTFGSPLDPFNSGKYGISVVTTNFNPVALISIFCRNLSLQLQTPIVSANNFVENLINSLLVLVHISPADPATSFFGCKYAISTYTTSDDFAGSPVHIVLICLFFLMLFKRSKKLEQFDAYTAIVCVGSVLLMSLIKWQPWNARLELPLMILFCPLMALGIRKLPGRAWSYCAVVLLFCMAWPCLVTNSSRPLEGPNSVLRKSHYATYFMGNHQQRKSFDVGVQKILPARPSTVGLITARDSEEYLLFAAIAHAGMKGVHIVQMCVDNPTKKIHSELSVANPEYVFGISPDESQVKELISKGYHYVISADNQSQNLQLFALTKASEKLYVN
jgi:hypothetical protein